MAIVMTIPHLKTLKLHSWLERDGLKLLRDLFLLGAHTQEPQ